MTSGYQALPIGAHNPSVRPSQATPSVALLATELLRFGMVSMKPSHPLFRNGPVPGDMIVFPRTAFRLARQRDRTRTVDSSVAVTYFEQQEFRREAATADGSHGMWIAISPIVRTELCARAGLDAFPATAITLSTQLFAAAHTMFRHLRDPFVDTIELEERALTLLRALFAGHTHGQPLSRTACDARVDLVERTRLLLAQDLTSTRSLGTLAALVNASPGHLCRSFHAVTGMTIRAYRRDVRLRMAIRWLDDTSHDLARIALELGFASHAHFTMWFRRTWGITPSQYRAGLAPLIGPRA